MKENEEWQENHREGIFWIVDKCLNVGCDGRGCYYNLDSLQVGDPFPVEFVEHLTERVLEFLSPTK